MLQVLEGGRSSLVERNNEDRKLLQDHILIQVSIYYRKNYIIQTYLRSASSAFAFNSSILLLKSVISSPRFFSFSYAAFKGASLSSTSAMAFRAILRRSLLASSFSRSRAWISTCSSSLRRSSLSISSGAVSRVTRTLI